MKLYKFQEEDVAKLAIQRSALIGSEMGTGKTHEAIALDELWWANTKKPTLVVTPLNTFDSWQDKYGMQTPASDVVILDRKRRDTFVEDIRRRRGDVFVAHWEALRYLVPEFKANGIEFGTVIADEVHRASNRKAQATVALKKIPTMYKIGMSGTASGDKPWNLWSILNWLYPRKFSSYWSFVRMYGLQEDVEVYRSNGEGKAQLATYRKFVGVQNVDRLHDVMDPFYVRHLKKEKCCEHHPEGVMHWLPDKTYDKIWVDLNPTQRRMYNQMKDNMVAWVGEHENDPLVAGVVVAQMTRLSQIALATPASIERYIDNKDKERTRVTLADPSSKIDAVMALLEDHPDKKMVVFTSSKQAAELCRARLEGKKIRTEVLSGDTPDSVRLGLARRMAEDEFQILVAVIQAAAEGIDGLQHATDTAVFLDRSWSTIKNKQAEDRLHRDGTKDTVQIIDVMARDTLDFGRMQRLENKWAWIKQILGDKEAQKKVLEGTL